PARKDSCHFRKQAVIAAKYPPPSSFLVAIATGDHLKQRHIFTQQLAPFRIPAAGPETQPTLKQFERILRGFLGDAGQFTRQLLERSRRAQPLEPLPVTVDAGSPLQPVRQRPLEVFP